MMLGGFFDRVLVQPMNVFFLYIIRYINFIGIIDLIPGCIIFFWAADAVNFSWSFPNIIRLLIVIAGGVLIRAALFLGFGSAAFWTNNRDAFVGLLIELFHRTTFYPLSIYPRVLQMVLSFVIPVGFISFYPAASFLGKKEMFIVPVDVTVVTFSAGVFLFLIAYSIFKIGLTRYESSGS
jgi:ABC-2 type transport system permease protein